MWQRYRYLYLTQAFDCAWTHGHLFFFFYSHDGILVNVHILFFHVVFHMYFSPAPGIYHIWMCFCNFFFTIKSFNMTLTVLHCQMCQGQWMCLNKSFWAQTVPISADSACSVIFSLQKIMSVFGKSLTSWACAQNSKEKDLYKMEVWPRPLKKMFYYFFFFYSSQSSEILRDLR